MAKTSRLVAIKNAFWDPHTKKFLGRTGESWAKIIAFYITLYTCLAAIWALYFQIFHLTISDKAPKWQLGESLIGTNPGLGVRPKSPRHRVESALISYRYGPDGDHQHWVNDLSEYLEALTNDTTHKGNCPEKKDPDDTQSFCPFDNSSIPQHCTAAQNFSFPIGQPCILIKLNRIYGWVPDPYREKPAGYPQNAPFIPGVIQITCDGQHDPDKEHIGPVEYYPTNTIDTKYYPFYNQPGYQSPYVMVQFTNPAYGKLIYVECRAWAKNIEHDRYNQKGMTVFELFIEKQTW